MSIFKKTIFTGFAPNLTFRDVKVASSYLFLPWKWSKINSGEKNRLIEKALQQYFGIKSAYVFDSGRSALLYALKALDIKSGDEVLVQGYTCMVVVNAIIQSGGVPVFVDIDNDLNMSTDDLEKKISAKSKVLIVQHTLGMPAKMEKLLEIARRNKVLVIEDCAHSFGAEFVGKKLGTFGQIGMLSFGADKVVSSVRGGALITNDQMLGKKIEALQENLPEPRLLRTMQHLMHNPVFYFGKKLYYLYVGKALLYLAKKFGIINKIIYDPEKKGEKVDFYPSKMANSLAEILLGQLGEVDEINKHRIEIAQYYQNNIDNQKVEVIWGGEKTGDRKCIYLRYPILAGNSAKIFEVAKKEGIILGNWYNAVVAPSDVDFEKTKYAVGSCPNGERIARRSINLPTDRNISLTEAKKIVELINKYQ